ncbi:MAG: cupin domain-containing protein [Cyclobacteriaceae bacterium]|nr:cupin domain-containing protein [Cyclobacteriaceae bacterium]
MYSEDNIYFNDQEAGWEKMWEGIQRKIIGYDERLMLVKVRFDRGTVAPTHHHPHSQAAFIVKGRFEVIIGEEKRILSAGDGFYIPPDTEHSVVALEDGLVIDSFSPSREDFIREK